MVYLLLLRQDGKRKRDGILGAKHPDNALQLPDTHVSQTQLVFELGNLSALTHARAHGGATVGNGANDPSFKDGELAAANSGGVIRVELLGCERLDDDVAHLGGIVVGAEFGRAADFAMNLADELFLCGGGLGDGRSGVGGAGGTGLGYWGGNWGFVLDGEEGGAVGDG